MKKGKSHLLQQLLPTAKQVPSVGLIAPQASGEDLKLLHDPPVLHMEIGQENRGEKSGKKWEANT